MYLKIIILVLVSLIMVGCGTSAAKPTPRPTDVAEVMPTELPQTSLPKSEGEALFNTFIEKVGFACATCHYTNSDQRLIGPGLLNIATRYESYEVETEDLKSYLHQSIVEPHIFIAPHTPAFPDNVMPDTYGDVFTEDQINDLIDYIMSLGKTS